MKILYESEKVKKRIENFMQEYGHRGYKEMEFRSARWEETPNELISLINLMVFLKLVFNVTFQLQHPVKSTDSKPVDTSVLSKYSNTQRKLVMAMLPGTRKSLSTREITKNMVAKVSYLARKSYLRLANILVDKSIISDVDLIFFFARDEIVELVKSKKSYLKPFMYSLDPISREELVRQANKRRRIFPRMEMIEFPRVVVPSMS